MRERPTDSTIRVWVPGCSTGEEAYSLAMLITEQAEAAGKSFDRQSCSPPTSRKACCRRRGPGIYPAQHRPATSAPSGSSACSRRQDDTYRIRKTLREAITFAPQNLLQDPPFSRLDLISCRNLLIYLEPDIQKRVLGLFHFALREGGHLFLGPAETITGQEDLFQPVSKKWRIYRRLGPTRHDVVDFPLIGRIELGAGAEPDAPAARRAARCAPAS